MAAASRPRTRVVEGAGTEGAEDGGAFHNVNTDQPVAQNASRAERWSSLITVIAEDSSMTSCAASSRRTPRGWSSVARRSP